MKIPFITAILAMTLITSSVCVFADTPEDETCKAICTNIVKAFNPADHREVAVVSCTQKGDIDGDSLSLVSGTMSCQAGYLTDIGRGEMDVQGVNDYTINIKQAAQL